MTQSWSLYVIILTTVTIIGLVWLVLSASKGQSDDIVEDAMDHSWDGIQEYDNPLPRWWFLLYMGTVVFSIGYLILYPGMGNFKGVLDWTSAKQWEQEVDEAEAQYGPIFAKYRSMSVEDVAKDAKAMDIGYRLFSNHCAVCHGTDAKGTEGYPNLADKDWRWGGTAADIKATIEHGRKGIMPAWGEIIGEEGVKNVSAYVRQDLAGLKLPEGTTFDLEHAKKVFTDTCVACHGPEGKGMPMLGSPDLTSPAGWMYGATLAQIQNTVRNGRSGEMPAQKEFLDSDKIHILSAYVYGLSN